MVRIKKTFYIFSFLVLGVLLSLIVHAGLEYSMLELIVSESGIRWFSWETWLMVHAIGSITLVLAGMIFGIHQGLYWWNKLYDKKGHVRGQKHWWRR